MLARARLSRLLVLVAALALLAAACETEEEPEDVDIVDEPEEEADETGDDDEADEPDEPDEGEEEQDVTAEPESGVGEAALIVAQGGLGDESYNDLAAEGFNRGLAEAGLSGTPIESEDIVAQGENVLRRAADSGFEVVVDLEFAHGEILGPVAADYPDTNWAIVNTEVEGDNVASVLFAEQEGSYLAGALAAMVTTDGDVPHVNPDEATIGVIGGTESVGIDKFIVGFVEGARDTDPDVEVLVNYAGDFGDPALGQQLAQSMFEEGADIVYHVAGGTGAGVIEAAEEAGRYAIGVDTDQDDLAPGHVLTSMVKRVDVATEQLLVDHANGEFPGGETLHLGLADDGVGLSEFEFTGDDIPDEYLERVEELEQQIIDGEIEPVNVVEDGYPDFFEQ